jgi:hypothetical protein
MAGFVRPIVARLFHKHQVVGFSIYKYFTGGEPHHRVLTSAGFMGLLIVAGVCRCCCCAFER